MDKSPSHTSDEVPQVESLVSFDALVRNLACVVDTERQTDHCKADGRQQEEDHHHMKATVQCPHQLWKNWTAGWKQRHTDTEICQWGHDKCVSV